MNLSSTRAIPVLGASIASAAGVCAVALLPGVASAATVPISQTDTLFSTPQAAGENAPFILRDGGILPSPAGGFYLTMQSDGNLVEYLSSTQRAVWSSSTSCSTSSQFVFQQDNNAVVYCGDTATFSTGTGQSSDGAGSFTLSDDGSLNVTGPRQWDNGVHVLDGVLGTLSSAGVFPHHFVMQADGNLVLYSSRSGTGALWSSGTAGNPGSIAIAQTDGNLVIYNATGRALWSSQTLLIGTYGTYLIRAQEDGNVVIYQQDAHTGSTRAVWQTGTAGQG